jgi:hypothetical protein
LGSTVATVQHCLFRKNKEETHEHHNKDHNESEHIIMRPYNEEESKEIEEEPTPVVLGPDGKPIKKVNCYKIMSRADVEIIKPLLIYNYESISHKRQKEFFDLMMK